MSRPTLILPLKPIKDRPGLEAFRVVSDRLKPLLPQPSQIYLTPHAGPVPASFQISVPCVSFKKIIPTTNVSAATAIG